MNFHFLKHSLKQIDSAKGGFLEKQLLLWNLMTPIKILLLLHDDMPSRLFLLSLEKKLNVCDFFDRSTGRFNSCQRTLSGGLKSVAIP
jgi:hypothetical protein